MNKKIIATLLITSMTITGLFAYTAPSILLTAKKSETDYQFKIQRLSDDLTVYTDLVDGEEELVTLDETGGTTNAFAVSTIADGNMSKKIAFSTLVTTGEFLDQSDSSIGTGWFPVIEDMSTTVTNKRNEIVTYTLGVSSNFNNTSTGTYKTTFKRGKHLIGTEIARFKLQYKGDDEIVAGSYRSTTTINITTELV